MANDQARDASIRRWDGREVAVRAETARARALLQERMTQLAQRGHINRAGVMEAEAHFDGNWDDDPDFGSRLALDGINAHGSNRQGSPWRPVSAQTMVYLESVLVVTQDGRVQPVSWNDAGRRASGVEWDGTSSWRSPDDARAQISAESSGISSQAGFAAVAGPRNSYASVPKPGEPGSRFSPRVVDRRPQPSLRPSDVPRAAGKKSQQTAKRAEQQEQRAVSKRLAAEGIRGGLTGAQVGAKAGSVVPGVGAAAGTAIGTGVGAGVAQSKVAREAGDPKLAFVTAASVGGVVGGAVNAKLAADVRAGKQVENPASLTTDAPEAEGEAVPAKTLPIKQRVAESKVGQAVQSESFKSGARRVGAQALREAAAGASRAKGAGSTGKTVAAFAAKAAVAGVARGIQTEIASRNAETAAAGQDSSTADTLVGKVGEVVSRQSQSESRASRPDTQKTLSEQYDYKFEDKQNGLDNESQYDT